jgi:glutamate--cysteine ligase catalytic subunit
MDIQLTDFENTCLIVMLGLITNVINHFNVDFILPISLADANMERAHYRDALLNQKFWFKTNCVKDIENYHKSNLADSDYLKSQGKDDVEQCYEELYIHEIFNGKG